MKWTLRLVGIVVFVAAVASNGPVSIYALAGGLMGLSEFFVRPQPPQRGELPDLREAYPPSRF